MKLIGAVLGLAAAWALYRFAPPTITAIFYSATGVGASIGVVATLLTAPWAAALARLSVFEKLDDLPASQVEIVMRRARSTRRFIIRSMIVNALAGVLCTLTLTFFPKSAFDLYCVSTCFGIWFVGLFQAYRCWHAAEESRITIASAQAIERKRKKYLEALRADDQKSPVNRKDEHLNGYARS